MGTSDASSGDVMSDAAHLILPPAQVNDAQVRVRVALLAVDLDRRADASERRLRENVRCQGVHVNELAVSVQQLVQQALECDARRGVRDAQPESGTLAHSSTSGFGL